MVLCKSFQVVPAIHSPDIYYWSFHFLGGFSCNDQRGSIKAQIEGTDMVVHASTGAGKTTIAAGPHTWIKDGVTLISTPLIQLAEEMVRLKII